MRLTPKILTVMVSLLFQGICQRRACYLFLGALGNMTQSLLGANPLKNSIGLTILYMVSCI